MGYLRWLTFDFARLTFFSVRSCLRTKDGLKARERLVSVLRPVQTSNYASLRFLVFVSKIQNHLSVEETYLKPGIQNDLSHHHICQPLSYVSLLPFVPCSLYFAIVQKERSSDLAIIHLFTSK